MLRSVADVVNDFFQFHGRLDGRVRLEPGGDRDPADRRPASLFDDPSLGQELRKDGFTQHQEAGTNLIFWQTLLFHFHAKGPPLRLRAFRGKRFLSMGIRQP